MLIIDVVHAVTWIQIAIWGPFNLVMALAPQATLLHIQLILSNSNSSLNMNMNSAEVTQTLLTATTNTTSLL
jgi:hypothetical protein